MIRPSSLPMLDKCAKFESGETDFTESGTDRHAALTAHFSGDDSLLSLLDEQEGDAVRWAAEYIRVQAPLSDHPIAFEKTLSLIGDDFQEVYRGTPDAVCNRDLFDLKWRERDYAAQMAAYALMLLQDSGDFVRVHVLFGERKRAQVYKLDRESAQAIVFPILEKAKDPAQQPNPCEYCNWCANRLTCKPYLERANAVAAGREDWSLTNYHVTQITDEVEMAKALALARLLAGWCKSVEFHAREMAVKQGKQLPGFALKEKAARKYCNDVAGAFGSLMFSLTDESVPDEAKHADASAKFFAACDLRLNTSKKYPDKKGIINIVAEVSGEKLAPTKRTVTKKIEAFLSQGSPTLSLVATKGDGDSTSTETEGEE